MQSVINPLNTNMLENATAQPNFLVPILIGLAIAIAVQLLLTHFAAALGLSAAGDLIETDDSTESSSDSEQTTLYERVQRVNHLLGAWGLVSATIAVFAGAWLAAETSLSFDPMSGIVIGLAIWAVFYCAAMYLEATLVGSMLRRAGTAVSTAAGGVSNIFSKSPKAAAAAQASAITAAVRDELLEDRRVRTIGKDLRTTLDQLELHSDPRTLRKELEVLIERTDVELDTNLDEHGEIEGMSASLHTRSLPSRDTIKKIGGSASRAGTVVADEYSNDRRPADSTARGVLRLAGISSEDADRYLGRFEDYLRAAGEDVLNPDRIKDELELLFEDPKAGWAALKSRFSHADRSTYEGLLTARGVKPDHASAVVERIAATIESVWPDLGEDGEPIGSRMSRAGDQAKDRAVSRIRSFLDAVDDRRLDGDAVERECELLFDDPRAGYDALVSRMRSLDRDTIKAIIASRPNRDEEEAEELVQRIEAARDRVAERAEAAKIAISEKTEQAKATALRTAEGTRRVATSAAWWAFGAAACSAASAALAGYLAIVTSAI
jgi:hypothetical protein